MMIGAHPTCTKRGLPQMRVATQTRELLPHDFNLTCFTLRWSSAVYFLLRYSWTLRPTHLSRALHSIVPGLSSTLRTRLWAVTTSIT